MTKEEPSYSILTFDNNKNDVLYFDEQFDKILAGTDSFEPLGDLREFMLRTATPLPEKTKNE